MAQSPSSAPSRGMAQLADDMKREFLDEAGELLGRLDIGMEDAEFGRRTVLDLVAETRRVAFRLRSGANSHGLGVVVALAHRLEDYTASVSEPIPPRLLDDLKIFNRLLLGFVEGRTSLDADTAAMVRRLPRKLGFGVSEVEVRDVEVMLVAQPGAQTHFVERELQQCGYRTIVVGSTFDALSLAVRTKPDLIIVSAVMPELSGIDLAIGLAAMPETRNIPLALITSLDPADDLLQLVPKKVPVIHKGPAFGDDLYKALDCLFLI